MRLSLREIARDDAIVTLATSVPRSDVPLVLRYDTRVGALLQVDGATAGAFDREHAELILDASERERRLTLDVERDSLPTHGLPSGPGLGWWWLKLRSTPRPVTYIGVVPAPPQPGAPANPASSGSLALWGHSHLDVAWLWTYEQAHRKAQRTFAIAADLLERDLQFYFIQSQPQLYAFVQERDPQLFARVRALADAGRFDADVAALWVESDCNLPSGESLLRQMLHAHDYCVTQLGVVPTIAWLPDSFGFANTLPTLLSHCGIERFATTKLQWNDTTRFPFPQFVWRGPDGSEVLGALIDGYDGGVTAAREQKARSRREPLVAGYGDGGGGVTSEMLATARGRGTWQPARTWFDELKLRRASLPVHATELYLQYHRGVFTTHHDLKAHNAALERRLSDAEELVAWCCAVRLPKSALDQLRARLNETWRIVLRNQFHDVLPGTSIPEAVADARAEYAQARELVERTAAAAQAMLPRAPRYGVARKPVEPARDGDAWIFDNGLIRARFSNQGSLLECAAGDAGNAIVQGNVLALYGDRPRAWEAWNIDSSYEGMQRPVRVGTAQVVDAGLEIAFELGSSLAVMRVGLHDGEPFVRVDLAVDWRERRTLLRVENLVAAAQDRVTYGSPHGVIERSSLRDSSEQRAMFEVPGQRMALVRGAAGDGLALFALDTYGWSARKLRDGNTKLGHSLLRGTTWPDLHADLGEAQLSWAFAPFAATARIGDLERSWRCFAHEPSVQLFTCDDPGVLVVACKPAQDGDGVIVRVRECNGVDVLLRLRSGGRMREASAVDGLERPLPAADARIEAESLVAPLRAFGLASFRVRF